MGVGVISVTGVVSGVGVTAGVSAGSVSVGIVLTGASVLVLDGTPGSATEPPSITV